MVPEVFHDPGLNLDDEKQIELEETAMTRTRCLLKLLGYTASIFLEHCRNFMT